MNNDSIPQPEAYHIDNEHLGTPSSHSDPKHTPGEHETSSNASSKANPSPTAGPGQPMQIFSVFAGWLLFVMAWGPTLTSGLFQDFYQREYLSDYSAFAIGWIAAINAFLLVVTGVIAGPLFDRGYLRHLMVLGCSLSIFGTMMLSLSSQYYQVFLAEGVCMGCGSGLVYVPALAMIGRLFSEKRSLAIGIVTTGASIGGVLMPIMFLRLQPAIGFPWTIRIIGFVQLLCVVLALPILWRLSLPAPAGRPRQLIHWYAFRQLSFVSYFVSGFLVFMAYLVPLVYIAPYSVQVLQQSPSTAYYQLALSNGASALGRLGAAWAAPRIGPPNILVFSLTSSGLLILAWIGVTTVEGFWVWCAFWGFCSGIIISINPVVVAHPAISRDAASLGTRLGMQWFSTSFGFLLGTPIAGSLLRGSSSQRSDYQHLQIFGGVVMLAGAAFFMHPWWAIRNHNRTFDEK